MIDYEKNETIKTIADLSAEHISELTNFNKVKELIDAYNIPEVFVRGYQLELLVMDAYVLGKLDQ